MTRWTPAAVDVVFNTANTASICALLEHCKHSQTQFAESTSDTKPSWQLKQLDIEAPDSGIGTLGLERPDGVTLSVDFTRGKARHRLNEAGHGAGQLKKSLGISLVSGSIRDTAGEKETHIIDTTGGLGQDAWAIASLGTQVTAYESNPLVYALLCNGLERAIANTEFRKIARLITLHNEDAITGLNHHSNGSRAPKAEKTGEKSYGIDAIYLDPMYPETRKSSRANKGMQFLQQLVGPPDASSNEQLLQSSLRCCARRVVVKRPKSAPLLEGSERWEGQLTQLQFPNTRYDVYHHTGTGI